MQKEYEARRDALFANMGDGVALILGAQQTIRNNDVHDAFRQDSRFHYLTGFNEPDAATVMWQRGDKRRFIMFVPPRDPKRELWDGKRMGVEGAVGQFGADEAHPFSALSTKLPELVQDMPVLWFALGQDGATDMLVRDAVAEVRRRRRQRVIPPRVYRDINAAVDAMRMVKSDAEIQCMRKASEVTREAHLAAMKAAVPGAYEYQVEAAIAYVFRSHGCEREAYQSIVGSGANATVLHYIENNAQLEDGKLLLVDAGCEYKYYASDVTRTYPIGGTFSRPQRQIYEIVLRAEEAAVAAVRPGATMCEIQQVAARAVAEGLCELGFIQGPVDTAVKEKRYEEFYMHRAGHYLGMDVHDVGDYYVGGEPRPLQPGNVITVEPGIYISQSAQVDEQYRGIGVRIEDDVLVTADGHENLTAAIPKSIDALEAILRDR